jgi:hypothetical protein
MRDGASTTGGVDTTESSASEKSGCTLCSVMDSSLTTLFVSVGCRTDWEKKQRRFIRTLDDLVIWRLSLCNQCISKCYSRVIASEEVRKYLGLMIAAGIFLVLAMLGAGISYVGLYEDNLAPYPGYSPSVSITHVVLVAAIGLGCLCVLTLVFCLAMIAVTKVRRWSANQPRQIPGNATEKVFKQAANRVLKNRSRFSQFEAPVYLDSPPKEKVEEGAKYIGWRRPTKVLGIGKSPKDAVPGEPPGWKELFEKKYAKIL